MNNKKGMALLLTVLIISILTVLVVQFNKTMHTNLYGAANTSDGIALKMLARSGLQLGRAVLVADGADTKIDTLHELWADPEKLDQGCAGLVGADLLTVRILDHSGRIQLNALGKMDGDRWVRNEKQIAVLRNFLANSAFGLEQEAIDTIIAALIDWLDPDDEVTDLSGAESSYYQNLENGYRCKNGPIESVEELLYIKGITSELYFGNVERPGIAFYLTPYGDDGAVNINTADPQVLLALSDQLSQDLVEGMVAYRDQEENDLSDAAWYKNVAGFPTDLQIDPDLLTTASSFFEVRAVTVRHGYRKSAIAVLQRKIDNKAAVVFWKIE